MSALQWDKEFAMEQAADDAELLQELLDIFKDSLKADIGVIEEGIGSADAEKVGGAAHSIKGAAASLGIEGIKNIAQNIEQDSREGRLEVAKEKLPLLQELMVELQAL